MSAEKAKWRPCLEKLVCDGGRCEIREMYCPICGCGPQEMERMYLHPIRVNHLPVWSCFECLHEALGRRHEPGQRRLPKPGDP